MTSAKRFPVLLNGSEIRDFPNCPRSLPWDMVEPYRELAMQNHQQTLERLAERGGLCPVELFMIEYKLNWLKDPSPSMAVAINWLESLVIDQPQEERKS